MKKFVCLLFCIAIALPIFSQEKKPFFKFWKRQKNQPVVVSDTVYIVINEAVTDTLEVGEVLPPKAIDTLDTDDKFIKVVLFDDYSWCYHNLGKPIIPDSLSDESWDENKVHAYKDLLLKDMPDEVDLLLVDSLHGYHIPSSGRIVSRYKFRSGREHNGIDIKLDKGDPVYAAFDGVVRVSLSGGATGGYGTLVIVRHMNGLETYYAHLSQANVKSGDLVKAGEVIGLGGSTGRSTGNHLHFECRYKGKSFDPERIFDFEKQTLRQENMTLYKHYFSIYSHYGQTDKQSKEASGRVIHVIKSGDTLGALARRYGTSVDKICKLNKISRNSTLRIGQRIVVR